MPGAERDKQAGRCFVSGCKEGALIQTQFPVVMELVIIIKNLAYQYSALISPPALPLPYTHSQTDTSSLCYDTVT